MSILYARMEAGELKRIAELDRSEHIEEAYEIRDGMLRPVKVEWNVPNWYVDRDGEHSVREQIEFCRSHLAQGGMMLGAFQDELLVGLAVVRPIYRERLAQLAFLHVSQQYRRRRIAGTLMEMAIDLARQAGAEQMYVSSVPSSSAVGFYLSQGCRLVDPPDPTLFALEPEDIHLILDL